MNGERATARERPARAGGVGRRTVLAGLGATGAGVLAGTGKASAAAAAAADPRGGLPDGIRPVPVRGGCTAAVGDAPCQDGSVGLYDRGGPAGLGQHTYRLTLNGVPLSAFGGALDYQQFVLAGGDGLRRLPAPPPSAGPDWGPYELVLPGTSVSLGADQDLAAPVRLVAPDCAVPAACRDRWCGAVGRTVDELRRRRSILEAELAAAEARLTGRTFSVRVPRRAAEPAARTQLRTTVNQAIGLAAADVRAAVASAAEPVDRDSACGDCPACVRLPRAHRVRSWELRTVERSTARWGGDDRRAWADHELRTTTVLEPARSAGIERLADGVGGPLGGLVGPLAGLLGDLVSGVDRLLGGGRPSSRSWMGTAASADGWLTHGFVASTDRGSVATINAASGSVTDSARLDQFGEVRMLFDEGVYELGVPRVPLTGRSRTHGLPRDVDEPFESTVGWGDTILRRAAETDAADPARFPLVESDRCGAGLADAVEVDLDGRGLIRRPNPGGRLPPARAPRGRASVAWELVPREIESGELRRLACP